MGHYVSKLHCMTNVYLLKLQSSLYVISYFIVVVILLLLLLLITLILMLQQKSAKPNNLWTSTALQIRGLMVYNTNIKVLLKYFYWDSFHNL